MTHHFFLAILKLDLLLIKLYSNSLYEMPFEDKLVFMCFKVIVCNLMLVMLIKF